MGPLGNVIQPSQIRRAGFSLNSTVADLNSNGEWVWPHAWLNRYPIIRNALIIHLNDKQDELIWKVNNVENIFTSSTVWNSLRSMDQNVEWVEAVWFSHCIPRQAFNMWLIMCEKLLTQDKILKWSPARRKNMNMMCCALCIADFDSHKHLFFGCTYAKQVWFVVRDVADMQHVPPTWKTIVAYLIARVKSRSISNAIGRLIVAVATYFIWQERNNRIFANYARPPDNLVKIIKDTVRARLWKLKFKKTTRVVRKLEAWGVRGDYIFQDGA